MLRWFEAIEVSGGELAVGPALALQDDGPQTPVLDSSSNDKRMRMNMQIPVVICMFKKKKKKKKRYKIGFWKSLCDSGAELRLRLLRKGDCELQHITFARSIRSAEKRRGWIYGRRHEVERKMHSMRRIPLPWFERLRPWQRRRAGSRGLDRSNAINSLIKP
jgi:hypothetical protein